MTVHEKILLRQVIAAWGEASRRLGIKIASPFVLRAGEISVDCIAFLPQFGSLNGMVIGACLPPEFDTDPALIRCAQMSGLYYSFINPERYAVFDEERFKEALSDWQFYGASDERPIWLSS